MQATLAAHEALKQRELEERNTRALQTKSMPGIPFMAPLPDGDALAPFMGRPRDDPHGVTEALLLRIDQAAAMALSLGQVGSAAQLYECARRCAADLLPKTSAILHVTPADLEREKAIREVQDLKRRDPAAAHRLKLELIAADEERERDGGAA